MVFKLLNIFKKFEYFLNNSIFNKFNPIHSFWIIQYSILFKLFEFIQTFNIQKYWIQVWVFKKIKNNQYFWIFLLPSFGHIEKCATKHTPLTTTQKCATKRTHLPSPLKSAPPSIPPRPTTRRKVRCKAFPRAGERASEWVSEGALAFKTKTGLTGKDSTGSSG